MKKKLLWGIVGIVVLSGIISNIAHTQVAGLQTATPTKEPTTQSPTSSPTSTVTVVPTLPTRIPTPQAYITTVPSSDTTTNDSGLSNDNYYTNSQGNDVHAPAYSTSGSAPEGATAQCVDGTYSFSQSRSGTCSHHGGVAQWY